MKINLTEKEINMILTMCEIYPATDWKRKEIEKYENLEKKIRNQVKEK